jgi:sulfur-carrier protein
VNLFVGPESVRFSGGLASRVADGAEVSILPAVSGGADHPRGDESDARRPDA